MSNPVPFQQTERVDIYTLEHETRSQKQSEDPNATQKNADQDDWKSHIKMAFHVPSGDLKIRLGKMDTGAKKDVISQRVTNALKLQTEEYFGHPVKPVGPDDYVIMPVGKVQLDWHVLHRGITYNTEFLVLPADVSKDFDILLSEDTIKEHGFLKVDHNLCWLKIK